MPDEEFKISCPDCEGHICFSSEYLGQRIACPHCAKNIVLLAPIEASGNPDCDPESPTPWQPTRIKIIVSLIAFIIIFTGVGVWVHIHEKAELELIDKKKIMAEQSRKNEERLKIEAAKQAEQERSAAKEIARKKADEERRKADEENALKYDKEIVDWKNVDYYNSGATNAIIGNTFSIKCERIATWFKNCNLSIILTGNSDSDGKPVHCLIYEPLFCLRWGIPDPDTFSYNGQTINSIRPLLNVVYSPVNKAVLQIHLNGSFDFQPSKMKLGRQDKEYEEMNGFRDGIVRAVELVSSEDKEKVKHWVEGLQYGQAATDYEEYVKQSSFGGCDVVITQIKEIVCDTPRDINKCVHWDVWIVPRNNRILLELETQWNGMRIPEIGLYQKGYKELIPRTDWSRFIYKWTPNMPIVLSE